MFDTTVPCKLCGVSTRMLSTKLCDACWELDQRVRAEPDKAMAILEEMGLIEPPDEEGTVEASAALEVVADGVEAVPLEDWVNPDHVDRFSFGKHVGKTHDQVLDLEPSYIKWAYENVANHAGISRSTYAAACEAATQQRGRSGYRHEATSEYYAQLEEWGDLPEPPRTWGDLDD